LLKVNGAADIIIRLLETMSRQWLGQMDKWSKWW